MSVLGIDPGKTTGVAALDDDGTLIDQGDFTPVGALSLVEAFTLQGGDRRVAIESFRVFPRYSSGVANTTALELIGAIKYLCLRNHVRLCLIAPGVHKGFKGIVFPAEVHFTKHAKDAYSVAYWALKFGKFQVVADF